MCIRDSIASVDNMGVVTGLGMGMVDVHAKSEGVKSNVITPVSYTHLTLPTSDLV